MEIVLASGNAGKLREFAQLFDGFGFQLRPQSEFGLDSAEETGLSFVENALLKARHAAAQTGLPALADDSGLAVDALQGAPGIYSARFAGDDADDAANNRLLLQRLDGVTETGRGAAFHCVLVLLRHAEDPCPLIAEGHWRGRILSNPRGDAGFGYDPLFLPGGLEQSSAELPRELKNRISHRGQAVAQLKTQLEGFSLQA